MTVRVTFLGTGNAFADGGRSHACILVTAPEGRILLDCGGSSLPAIRRACDPESIDAIAITHLHGDHFGGLVFFAMEAKYAPRRKALRIGGPPSLERRFKDASVALFDDFYRDLPYLLEFTVLGATAQRLGPAEVVAIPVDHVLSRSRTDSASISGESSSRTRATPAGAARSRRSPRAPTSSSASRRTTGRPTPCTSRRRS